MRRWAFLPGEKVFDSTTEIAKKFVCVIDKVFKIAH